MGVIEKREVEDLRRRVQELERELRIVLGAIGGGGSGGGGIPTVRRVPEIPTGKAKIVYLEMEAELEEIYPGARQKWGANPGDTGWSPLELALGFFDDDDPITRMRPGWPLGS